MADRESRVHVFDSVIRCHARNQPQPKRRRLNNSSQEPSNVVTSLRRPSSGQARHARRSRATRTQVDHRTRLRSQLASWSQHLSGLMQTFLSAPRIERQKSLWYGRSLQNLRSFRKSCSMRQAKNSPVHVDPRYASSEIRWTSANLRTSGGTRIPRRKSSATKRRYLTSGRPRPMTLCACGLNRKLQPTGARHTTNAISRSGGNCACLCVF